MNESSNLFEQAADNIRDNLHNVNKLLKDCEVTSNIANQESKISNFLSLNVDQLIESKPKDDYYDLNQISKIFEMLETTAKSEGKKKLKKTNMESSSSLLSLTSSQSVEDILRNQEYNLEYNNEVKSSIAWIKSTLRTIVSSSIDPPDLNSVKNKENSRLIIFSELMMNLKKLAKELQSIASSDQTANNYETVNIDREVIDGLNQLSETLTDINSSGNNPLACLPKQDFCSFELTSAINDILNVIEKNR